MSEVRVDGVTIAFDVHGDGPHVVLLLGPIGAPGATWVPFQVPALTAAGYRVVTFNPRGVPPSDVPDPPYSIADMAGDTAGLIEALACAPVAAVGYSMGALVAQELLLVRPELCSCGVLLGTLGRKDVFRKALFQASLEALESGQHQPPLVEAVAKAMQLFGPDRLDDDAWARQYLDFAGASATPSDGAARRGLLGQQAATTSYDDRLGALAGVTRPVLAIGFELDLLVPAKLTREVAAAISGASYIEVPGCGHGGPWEQPAAVNAHILAYLAEHA